MAVNPSAKQSSAGPALPHRDVAGMCLTTEAHAVLDNVLNEHWGMCSCLLVESLLKCLSEIPLYSKWMFIHT